MGFFQDIGRAIGLGKKKQSSYTGQKPYSTLTDIPAGQQYLDLLRGRIAGRGVGFREKELSGLTSPYAAQARAGLKEQTIPQISAQASARGLGRSTIPVSRIGLETSATERSIEERIAQLRLANEQQRRAEINQAVSGLGQFTQAEAAQRGQRAGFEGQQFQNLQGFQQQAEAQQATNLQNTLQNILGFGTFGAKLGGVGGFAPTPLFGTPTTGTGAPAGTGAQVDLGQLTDEERDYITKALQALRGK